MKVPGASLSSFFILILLLPVTKTAYTIHIDPKNGNDSSTCLTGRIVCTTLHYVVNGINNSSNVVIVLANGIHSINDTIYVSDVNNVTLNASQAGGAVLHCDGSNAGLKLVRIINFSISGVRVENCGAFADSTTRVNETSMAVFRAAVYFLNSTNITIESSAFVDNRGIGLVLYDVNGYVSIQNSNFTNNFVPKDEQVKYNGGGGLYIEHTYCTPGLVVCDYRSNSYNNNSEYRISRCNFINNSATTPPEPPISSELASPLGTESKLFGSGGGLQIILKGISNNNMFVINSCTFENNSAKYGGGVNVNIFQDYIKDEFYFESCNMLNNSAEHGGGGIVVGLLFHEIHSILYSLVSFNYTNITYNYAPSGAGVYFFSSRIKSNEINATCVLFSDCIWYQNSGTIGAAVMLAPDWLVILTDGYLPVPEFTNCLFEDNKIIPKYKGNNVLEPAVGTLFSSTITVNFSSSVVFVGNNGTAISITAGSINILQDAVVEFRNNTGVHGGALALLEFASLRLFSGSFVSFINNYASELGGAIYASAQDELDFLLSRSCFIHYEDVTVPAKRWNVSIIFEHNLAGPLLNVEDQPLSPLLGSGDSEYARGSSIFAVTIHPCIRASNTQITGDRFLNNTFPRDLGNPFTFTESCSNTLCGIATAPALLEISPEQFDSNGVLRLSPGENRNLSLTARDDLNNRVSVVVTASVFPPGVATVDSASIYITDSMVQINGKIHSTFTLTLHTTGRRQISTSAQALFIDCPPGFVYEAQKQKCVCSAATQTQRYLGITRCDIEKFNGLLNKRYWAGCDTSDTLLTAACPAGYCRDDDDASDPFYILPHTCQELEDYLCGPRHRKGRLCGECANNYTVFFHSEQYNCKECKYGYLGWLLYILSELLPVTLVFLTVVLLNVHITAGMWNSIILYAQIMDFIGTRSHQSSVLPRGLSILTNFYQLIYGSFNLDFFKFEDTLSFCLWDGAIVMDVLVFRYLTAAYAILLLLILLISFKSPCWNKCQGIWERGQAAIGRSHHKDLVIHGISAFLVLSYAFCVKVSFQLLSAVQLHGQGSTPVKRVLLLNGNIEFFSVDHIPYALPAIFVLILTTLPPVILIIYPNGLQGFSNCLGEQRMEKLDDIYNKPACSIIQKTFRISRFKPLFDSFQGCFKDRYRFFAGMFFLYRFLVSLISAVTTDVLTFHVTLEILSMFMLAFHAFAQPYQRPLYNYLDTFMFANLAVINALYLYNVYTLSVSVENQVTIVSAFQLILIYLPLVSITALWVLFVVTGCSKKVRYNLRKINQHIPLFKLRADEENEEAINAAGTEVPFDQEHLPHRMFDNSADDQDERCDSEKTTQEK